MRVSPQRRAFFRHRIFKKALGSWRVLYILTSKCAFRHSGVHFFRHRIFQKVLRSRRVLYIFTSKCAFRHSGVHFCDLRTSKSVPTPSVFEHFHFHMCFSPPQPACNFWCLLSAPTSAPAALTGLLFDWPDTRIIEKTQHFATSLTFGADCVFFLTFVLVHLLPSDLTACLICFSTLHIVGSLLFKTSFD